MNSVVSRKKVIVLLTAITLVISGVALFFVFRSRPTASDQHLSAYLQYQNKNAKIAFTYPSSLGVAQEELLEPSRNNLVTVGKALKITFSNTHEVSLIAASTGFAMFKESTYTGDDQFFTSCAHPGTFDADGNGCTVKTVNGNVVLVKTEYLADEGVYNLFRTFSFNIPTGPYKGLKVIQSVPTLYDQLNKKISVEERSMLLQKYGQELLKGTSRDNDLSVQLQAVDYIVQTMSFGT